MPSSVRTGRRPGCAWSHDVDVGATWIFPKRPTFGHPYLPFSTRGRCERDDPELDAALASTSLVTPTWNSSCTSPTGNRMSSLLGDATRFRLSNGFIASIMSLSPTPYPPPAMGKESVHAFRTPTEAGRPSLPYDVHALPC